MGIKEKRYIWLPIALMLYGLAMAAYFGPEIIAAGQGWKVWLTLGVDVVVCYLLFIFLRKRSRF